MSTPFTPGIPTTGQSLGITKFPIQNNFTALREAIDANHGGIGTTQRGLHIYLQMPEQSSPPPTQPNQGALYTKEVVGQTQLFWRQENSGGEFGWINIKDTLNLAPNDTTVKTLMDFTGYPDFSGTFCLRERTAPSYITDVLLVNYNGGVLSIGCYNSVLGNGLPGSAKICFGGAVNQRYTVSGSILQFRQATGALPAEILDWSLIARIYPTS